MAGIDKTRIGATPTARSAGGGQAGKGGTMTAIGETDETVAETATATATATGQEAARRVDDDRGAVPEAAVAQGAEAARRNGEGERRRATSAVRLLQVSSP